MGAQNGAEGTCGEMEESTQGKDTGRRGTVGGGTPLHPAREELRVRLSVEATKIEAPVEACDTTTLSQLRAHTAHPLARPYLRTHISSSAGKVRLELE
jgi:hypothetical protein